MEPTTYTVNEAGATSLRDAKRMTFGLGRYVTANVSDDSVVAVFVGLVLHYNGPMPAGMHKGSDEFYAWVRKIATDGETAPELQADALIGAVCEYSALHKWNRIPAVTLVDCNPAGIVPACADCAVFYAHMK